MPHSIVSKFVRDDVRRFNIRLHQECDVWAAPANADSQARGLEAIGAVRRDVVVVIIFLGEAQKKFEPLIFAPRHIAETR